MVFDKSVVDMDTMTFCKQKISILGFFELNPSTWK
jgi:hypothetical protein